MKILIANDGSDFGIAAVDFAGKMVDCTRETQIRIITVVEPAAAIEVEALIESVEALTDPENPLAQRANEIGESSARRLREACGEHVQISHEVLGGPAARTIVETAAEWKADLIVVGSHGYGFWKTLWLGSVSDRVVRHAHCSVLVVRRTEGT